MVSECKPKRKQHRLGLENNLISKVDEDDFTDNIIHWRYRYMRWKCEYVHFFTPRNNL